LGGHVTIDDFVIIGGLAAVQQFTHIGSHAMIGGLSGIDKNIIPFGLAANERAKLEGLNLVGMNRRKFDKRKSLEANKLMRELLSNEKNDFYQKLENIKNTYPDNEIMQEIVKFILEKENNKTLCRFREK
jgi:UDP-N-acetylglucosamine acyltransferase